MSYERESEAPMSDVPEPHEHKCTGAWTGGCGLPTAGTCACKCGFKLVEGKWVEAE